jgi:hypothetical protein
MATRERSLAFESDINNINKAKALYKQNNSIARTAKEFNVCTSYMWKQLNNAGVITKVEKSCSSVCLPDSKYIIEMYLDGKGTTEIGSILNYNPQAVLALLHKMDLVRDTKTVFNTLDHSWLSNIDSEYKAYFLGWMASDGSITRKEISISVQEPDGYILKELAAHINENIVIKTYPPYNKSETCQNQCRLVITSQQWVEDLYNLNITERKSLTLKAVVSKIPMYLQHHFVRGFFDGNGCLTDNNITILSAEEFLIDLQQAINIYPSYIRKKHGYNIYVFSIYKNECVDIFKQYIYQDATIYLKRKRDKFI